jgi:bacillithiol biosynthesis deacetylase BshB1
MVDILAISPHPDDAEIGCGGLLIKLKRMGYKTGILQMTLGEMGTGGTKEIRIKELETAANLMELDYMEFAGFNDCQIADSFENRLKVASYIRKTKPKIILIPYWKGDPGRKQGHTDHLTTGHLASHAVNFARLHKMPLDGEPHEVKQILYYLFPRHMKPTIVVDITEVASQWIRVLKSHKSQMFSSHGKKIGFFQGMVSWSKYIGYSIGARYGQGFISASPLKVDDPFTLI